MRLGHAIWANSKLRLTKKLVLTCVSHVGNVGFSWLWLLCSVEMNFVWRAKDHEQAVFAVASFVYGHNKETLTIVHVQVRDNNVDQALRALKKKLQREGVFREMKMRRNFEKPSERRAREKAEAVRRYRKLQRKRQEREGF